MRPQSWAKGTVYHPVHTHLTSGPRAPHYPQQVRIRQITPNSATIQWTVPSIAYTPETYVVKYGTSQDNLNLTSGSQHSGPDITIGSRSYSVQLSGLRVATLYYFSVMATNTVGPNEANDAFQTNEIGIAYVHILMHPLCTEYLSLCICTAPGAVSHVSVESVNSSSLNVSWGAASPANGVITHYLVWVNSSTQHQMTNTATDMRNVTVQGLCKLTSSIADRNALFIVLYAGLCVYVWVSFLWQCNTL